MELGQVTSMAESDNTGLKPRGLRRLVPQPLRLVWRQLPGLFNYPKTILEEDTADYDVYWKEKRGGALGELSPFQEKRARLVAELIETNAKVLDIGCGDGAILNYLRERKQIEPWGVDQSEAALAQAKESGVKTIMGDLRDPKVLDAIPEVGSFAVRHLAKIKKSDFKLSPKNQAGVFVGFATLKGTYGSVLMVGEGSIALAVLRLLELERTVVEGGGATAIAGFLEHGGDGGALARLRGKRVGAILCGGNIDMPVLGKVIERGLAADGRIHRFVARVSDRPGGIAHLTGLIADTGASVKDLYHERAGLADDFAMVSITVWMETRDAKHAEEVARVLEEEGISLSGLE